MSNTDNREPVVDPAPPWMIWWMGSFSFLIATLLFYLLVTTWPVLAFADTAFRPVNIFGWSHSWSPDRQLMFTVMVSGAIGGLAHSMKSFGDYVGNRELSSHWVWFLILRLPIGTAIALFFYCVIRGGILIPTIQSQPHLTYSSDATLQINPYAMAAFGALAGMFSKQATDKPASVFDAMFSMKEPVQREDKLGEKKPVVTPAISSLEPAQLTTTTTSLTINGQAFQHGCTVTVNGADRQPTEVSDKKIVIPLVGTDVATAGSKLKLVVKNPDGGFAETTVNVA
jgi:hypothetical protein